MALQANGKIVAVGRAQRRKPNRRLRARPLQRERVARHNFSGDGKQRPTSGATTRPTGWRSRANGKIVAVGDVAGGDFALARYNPNGSLDTSFSGDGKQTTDFGGNDGATGVKIQGDGKIVTVGVGLGTDGTRDFALARYLGG